MKTLETGLCISLHGQFRMATTDGRDVTPRGKKAIALIAMLAECDRMQRSRRWLERKLWSDRQSDQARGSLRQTLFEIRKSLGEFGCLVLSDRSSVWLDTVHVRRQPAPERLGSDFLEGLEIDDLEFSQWLARKRLAYQPKRDRTIEDGKALASVRIQCGTPWTLSTRDSLSSRVVDEQIGKLMSHFIARSHCAVLGTDIDLLVRSSIEESADGCMVMVQVVNARTDTLVYSDYQRAESALRLLSDKVALGAFCWMVADRTLERIAVQRRNVDPAARRTAYAQDAINGILSFEKSSMTGALRVLNEASEYLDDGLFYALKAWSLTSLIMEDHLVETDETRDKVRACLDRTVEGSSSNSMIAAIAANVQAILFGDYQAALATSRAALRDSPSNIFALQAASLCKFNQGDAEGSYHLSLRNLNIAKATKFRPMVELHHALLCLQLRHTDEALQSAKTAAAHSPAYRAPNRQLVALYAAGGALVDARAQIDKLSAIEPDFSVERFLADHDYPSHTLRSTGYLARAAKVLERK